MAIPFRAATMPFGKRGLVEAEEPAGVDLPELPANATVIERLVFLWKLCKKCYPLHGIVTFVHHIFLSGALAVAILFISSEALTRFAEAMKPHWPLLARAEPYMDAHGHHQLFLYMAAMYFKDAALAVFFLIRNLFWQVPVILTTSERTECSFAPRSLLGLVGPVLLFGQFQLIYDGPLKIPASGYLDLALDGGILGGLVAPALFAFPLWVFMCSVAPMQLLFPNLAQEGREKIAQAKRIAQARRLK